MTKSNEFLNKTPYRIRRYVGYVAATIVALALPFIRIDGNHIFLLSFDKKQLHLLGTAFDMQELYLMPFLLMLLFLGIFAATSLGGRAWCGWACPQTIFRTIFRYNRLAYLCSLVSFGSNRRNNFNTGKAYYFKEEYPSYFITNDTWLFDHFCFYSFFKGTCRLRANVFWSITNRRIE